MTNPDTLARVERACADLHTTGQPVTFTAIAEHTGLSRTTLYRDDRLRAVINEHRNRSNDPRTLSGLTAEIGHLRTAVETIAYRRRTQEERLRQLEHQPRQQAN